VTDTAISFKTVSKSFDRGKTFAVKNLDLNIADGEFLALVGESGCGKTTTLKLVNRLIEPSSGKVEIHGEDISTISPVLLRRRIGYVFQEIGLFPHLSVLENVRIVLDLLGRNRAESDYRTAELLDLVGLESAKFRSRVPCELSGGQKQRVGVARALAADPELLIMDEPFGALDPITRERMQDEFKSIQQRLGLTVMLVTHDMVEALLLADRVAVMKEGVLVELGTPDHLITGSIHPYARQLLHGPMNQARRLGRIDRREGED
jgi:osmoprotectant transport system ATP-binding protein